MGGHPGRHQEAIPGGLKGLQEEGASLIDASKSCSFESGCLTDVPNMERNTAIAKSQPCRERAGDQHPFFSFFLPDFSS